MYSCCPLSYTVREQGDTPSECKKRTQKLSQRLESVKFFELNNITRFDIENSSWYPPPFVRNLKGWWNSIRNFDFSVFQLNIMCSWISKVISKNVQKIVHICFLRDKTKDFPIFLSFFFWKFEKLINAPVKDWKDCKKTRNINDLVITLINADNCRT